MQESFLLSRVLLHFNSSSADLLQELSAVARTPEGHLWVASDELNFIERLSPIEPYVFGEHRRFAIADYIDLFNQDDEIDIEGMDFAEPYLWFMGSHSKKRGKPKGKKPDKDLQKLATVETELNRYLLARIPVVNGELFKSCEHPSLEAGLLTAACLKPTENGNQLIDALKQDDHLGVFVSMALPSKENGLDIEGIAVCGNHLFLGLRGPVLRGWAVILEVEIEEPEPGTLNLKTIDETGLCYKKYFVNLNGLGIRELCLWGDDLIILAGPTMDLEGAMQVFRLQDALSHASNTLFEQDTDALTLLFNLQFTIGGDHAEGLSLFPCLGQPNALLVVYDSPHAQRSMGDASVFADVFRLE